MTAAPYNPAEIEEVRSILAKPSRYAEDNIITTETVERLLTTINALQATIADRDWAYAEIIEATEVMEINHSAQLAAAERSALERAASWHDARAEAGLRHLRAFHSGSAQAIRAMIKEDTK